MEAQARVIIQDKQDFKLSLGNSRELIEEVELKLLEELSDSKGIVREMCYHILKAGGKRIRPLLVLYSGRLFSGSRENLVKAAVAAELIHMASLVHDDIIDVSMLRKKRPSVNCNWGNSFAVLCGDYLFAKAFSILSRNRLIDSMDYMVEAIQNMCQGEVLQAGDRFSNNVELNIYYERISMKTAIFLKCCCKSGAYVGGAEDYQVQLMGDFGLNIGLAFQIIDDILDFCGDPNVMGKPKFEDLSQGNITIPIIFLLMNEKYSRWLSEIIAQKDFSKENMDKINYSLLEAGIFEDCFRLAESHVQKAKECLTLLPESPYKDLLYNMADILMTRKS